MLGVVAKTKPDVSVKHCLVWALRRSGMNSLIILGGRIVLPRIRAFFADIVDFHEDTSAGEPVFFFGAGAPDAFH